jgi:hypothetical protein
VYQSHGRHKSVEGEELGNESDSSYDLAALESVVCSHVAVFEDREDIVVAFVVGLAAALEDAVDLGFQVLSEDDMEPAAVGWADPD